MLGKVLKYDLKYVYKVIVVFYILTILFAGLTRIFWSIENSTIMGVFGSICNGITICLMFSILINNMMRLWSRLVKNLYGDESYLTHTLPVEKGTIYTSKFLCALITTFTSVAVIIISIFIAYYSKENLEFLKASLDAVAMMYDTSIINFLAVVFGAFFLEIVVVLQAGYTGIIIGHKANDGKMIKAVIWGFILYVLTMGLSLLTLYISGLFRTDIMKLFTMSGDVSIDTVKFVLYLGIIFYTLLSVVYFAIDTLLFKKGVDVD